MTIHTFPAKPKPFEKLVTYRPAHQPQYAADVTGCLTGYRVTVGSYSRTFGSLTIAGRFAREINEAVAAIVDRHDDGDAA